MFSRSIHFYALALIIALAIVLPGILSDARGELPVAVDQTANNVVRVKVGSSLGSGVYIGSRYVLTARHLFTGPRTNQASVTFRVGNEVVGGRLVSAVDSDWDSAAIQLDREPTTPVASLSVSRDVRPGDVLWVAGYSKGPLQYRHGPVDGFRRLKKYPSGPAWYVQFDAPCYSGDSGGPVFMGDGTLVGTMWGSGSDHECSNEDHRTYSIAVCARFTRKFFGSLFPRGRPKTGCPGGICPVDPVQPGERPRLPWDGKNMPPPVPDVIAPPPVDLSGILAELAGLREAIENIQLKEGPKGEPGTAGEKGEPGAAGNDGTDGTPFDIATLTDEDIKALVARLPPIRMRTITADGVILQEISEPLGKPLTLRFMTKSGSK